MYRSVFDAIVSELRISATPSHATVVASQKRCGQKKRFHESIHATQPTNSFVGDYKPRETPLRFPSWVELRLLPLDSQEEVGLLQGWVQREGELCSFSPSLLSSQQVVLSEANLPAICRSKKAGGESDGTRGEQKSKRHFERSEESDDHATMWRQA